MIREKLFVASDVISKYKNIVERTRSVCSIGHVQSIVGNLIRSKGPNTRLGNVCNIIKPDGGIVPTEVIGFESDLVLLAPLESLNNIQPNSRVVDTGEPFFGHISEELIGRSIDAMCRPLDQKPKVISKGPVFLDHKPPNPLDRPLITEPFYTGIRTIDSFLTLGKGQRIGVFSGSGVGKSTLLGMIARYAHSDVNVIALIGERSREVNEFIQRELGEHGMKKTVVVVASANESPMHKIKAAYLAIRTAEFFRDQGKEVLFLLDSITRMAMAQREIGLAGGEPAATKGYPPSVYSMLPDLLERAGTSPRGSITGIYTVLVEADDMNEPISDSVRGVLDGHIVLDRELANKAHFPAIDVPGSISRLMPQVTAKENQRMASYLRELISLYKENQEIITMGAYTHGSNAQLDRAIQVKSTLDEFLKQEVSEHCDPHESQIQMKRIYDSSQHAPQQSLRKAG